jgi:signal transduction histidine kinase
VSKVCKILIIDDSEDDRSLYKRALQSAQRDRYETVEAESGDLGLKFLNEIAPDCVLLDYSLPGRNGLDVLKLMRASHKFVPVVMLTGQGNENIAVSAMQAGAQNYIVKANLTAEEIDRSVQLAIAHCAMQRRIEEQRVSLEIFSRALAHDLKEPVRTIRSFISLLSEREGLSDEAARYFGYVREASERMGLLIDAVHLYTSLDGASGALVKAPVELGAIVQEAQADLSELIREKQAVITVSPLPRVNVCALQVRQVVQNLVTNAIRHAQTAPVIQIDCVEREGEWLIRVADNGPGVEAQQAERIFQPFVRLGGAGAHGLGMGLAICRRVIETHGGKIWCEPRRPNGSLFQFTLAKEAVLEAPAGGESARANSKERKAELDLARVLVVDDNEAAIELTRIMLMESAKLRCELLSAMCGEDALALMADAVQKGAHVDLVLLDINMPRMDGFQVLQQIREGQHTSDVPVIMCTTSTYDKDLQRAQELGATGYVNKPATLQNLRPVIERIERVRVTQSDGTCALVRVA